MRGHDSWSMKSSSNSSSSMTTSEGRSHVDYVGEGCVLHEGIAEPDAITHAPAVEGIVEEVVVEDWLLEWVGGLESEFTLAHGEVKARSDSDADRVLVIETPAGALGGIVAHVNYHVVCEM